jgi:hypothetical protein
VNRVLEELRPLADRVIAGYESEWDGNNHVARFDEDAQEAIEEIGELLNGIGVDDDDIVQVWDAGDWLGDLIYRSDEDGSRCSRGDQVKTEIEGYGTITASTTDDELHALARAIEDDLEAGTILNGLEEFLEQERDEWLAGWTISDGNATETYWDWRDLILAAETWYDYFVDNPDEYCPGVDVDTLPTADYSAIEEGDVEALNAAISARDNSIAEWLGKTSFHGHGTYSVSAASQAGLNLSVDPVE